MDESTTAGDQGWATRAATRPSCDAADGECHASLPPSVRSPPTLHTWFTMSAIDRSTSTDDAVLDELPEFELTYLYDDDETPTEVTVFEGTSTEDLTTRWITMDYQHTIALDSLQ